MTGPAGHPPVRRRGRPSGGGGDARRRILDTARRRFAADGFAATSLRSIAAEAGVDSGLVHHYFADKAALLAAALDLPFNPLERLTAELAGGRTDLGARLVRRLTVSWDEHPDAAAALLRAAAAPGSFDLGALAGLTILPALTAALGGRERRARATLVVTQLVGLMSARYLMRLDPVAALPPGRLARLYGPSLQRLIDG